MVVRGLAGGFLVALAGGCCCFGGRSEPAPKLGKPNVSVQPGSSGVRKVAVMPFRSQNELVGATVADYFVSEILGSKRYELVERSQIGKVLSESELALSGISDSKAAEVGSMVGADGVVIGTVGDYETVTQGRSSFAVVSVAARMIDTKSGKIVWSVDLACRASDPKTTLSEHARHVVREMMRALDLALRSQRR
jgi:curli biogenesis system outer membrane secretion channel CsgG